MRVAISFPGALEKAIIGMIQDLNEVQIWAIRNGYKEAEQSAGRAKSELLALLKGE